MTKVLDKHIKSISQSPTKDDESSHRNIAPIYQSDLNAEYSLIPETKLLLDQKEKDIKKEEKVDKDI